MSQWYYAQHNERKGPVPEEQLKQLVASGALKPTDLVWKTGMAAWRPASEVQALFGTVEDEPPPIPPADVLPKPINKPLPGGTRPSPLTAISTVLIVLASLPFFSCLCAISVSRTGAVCGLIHNGFVILAAVLTLRKKAYWLAFVACFLVPFGWLWMPTGGLQLVSALISLPVGIWCVLSLRRPDVIQSFSDQRHPLRWIRPLSLRRIGLIILCGYFFGTLVFGLVKTKLEQEADYRRTQERTENIAGAVHRVEAADKLWEKGQEAGAVQEYVAVLEKSHFIEDDDLKRRLYQRAVDYLAENGDSATARQLLEQVAGGSLIVPLTSSKAQALMIEARNEYERRMEARLERYRRDQTQVERNRLPATENDDQAAARRVRTVKGAPPYAHLEKEKGKLERVRSELMAKYKVKDLSDFRKVVPRDVWEHEWERSKTDIDALYAAIAPPPIEIDTNCNSQLSDITVLPPKLDGDLVFAWFEFPIKFRAKAHFQDEHSTGLIVRTLEKDGSTVEDSELWLNMEASPGDLVNGRFTPLFISKAYRFKVMKRTKK
jgi:hypothetical protein